MVVTVACLVPVSTLSGLHLFFCSQVLITHVPAFHITSSARTWLCRCLALITHSVGVCHGSLWCALLRWACKVAGRHDGLAVYPTICNACMLGADALDCELLERTSTFGYRTYSPSMSRSATLVMYNSSIVAGS